MSMSRKDYVGLAETLGDCLSAYAATPHLPERSGAEAIRYTIARVADHLALENERFIPETFIDHASAHATEATTKR